MCVFDGINALLQITGEQVGERREGESFCSFLFLGGSRRGKESVRCSIDLEREVSMT